MRRVGGEGGGGSGGGVEVKKVLKTELEGAQPYEADSANARQKCG